MQILTLTGNLGRDPELRSTQAGDQVCSFSVASKQGFKRDAPTEWFRCSVWGKRGETIHSHLRKGMKVTVVGEFTIGEYQGKPQYDVRVSDVDWQAIGERTEQPQQQPTGGGYAAAQPDLDDDVPF
jgi:single-strand DNA-binding protein